jgi:hypothetical protein
MKKNEKIPQFQFDNLEMQKESCQEQFSEFPS